MADWILSDDCGVQGTVRSSERAVIGNIFPRVGNRKLRRVLFGCICGGGIVIILLLLLLLLLFPRRLAGRGDLKYQE